MVLSPAFLERLMVWRLKSYTGDKPCSTTSKSTHQFAQKTGRYQYKDTAMAESMMNSVMIPVEMI
ncbi:hypothetical protein, partial [Bifidobacterium crudilactis]|jgi:hypothetical protein|uniref:hypothetical protein n=1 Tax=Bifidobacterium crudilactis TaxID=327277 RepID=UPI0023555F4A